MRSLRYNDGSGKMKVDGESLLPRRNASDATSHRFAGDVRAIEMPGLATMHTLFVRYCLQKSRYHGFGHNMVKQAVFILAVQY